MVETIAGNLVSNGFVEQCKNVLPIVLPLFRGEVATIADDFELLIGTLYPPQQVFAAGARLATHAHSVRWRIR